MPFIKTNIQGLIVFEPAIFKDERGHFFESYNKKLFSNNSIENNFVQDNQSLSDYGTLRGLHLQLGEHAQAKLVRVSQGEVLDVAIDLRKDSKTFGKSFSIVLSQRNAKQLFIPRGFGHGFCVLSKTAIFQYKVDNYYNKESESGIIFNDKTLLIDWMIPTYDIRLSPKDIELKTFDEYKRTI